MSLQWQFAAGFLYFELAIITILLLPFISPNVWRKIFNSRISKLLSAGSKFYFNFIICIFALLFFDAVREIQKYSGDHKESVTPHAEIHAHMKRFRSERNFFISGLALFLWFVIKRLITLLSKVTSVLADAKENRGNGAERTEVKKDK